MYELMTSYVVLGSNFAFCGRLLSQDLDYLVN